MWPPSFVQMLGLHISRDVTAPVGGYSPPNMLRKWCTEWLDELTPSSPVPLKDLYNPCVSGQDPLSTSVDRLGPARIPNFDFLWTNLLEPATNRQEGSISACGQVRTNFLVGDKAWDVVVVVINSVESNPPIDVVPRFSPSPALNGDGGHLKSSYELRWVMRTVMRSILAEIQLPQSFPTPHRHPKAPLAWVSEAAECGGKLCGPLTSSRNLPLPLVKSAGATCKSVEARRVHRMLAHDPITIPDKLLERRWPKGDHRLALTASECISFAEHEANMRPKALLLMEFASYCSGALCVGRHVGGVSETGKIISADYPAGAKSLTHPMVKEAKYRERTWGSHERPSRLGHVNRTLNHSKVFSAILSPLMAHLRKMVTDVMRLSANSKGLLEFLGKEKGHACPSQTLNDGENRIVSKSIRRTGKVGTKPHLIWMSRSIQAGQDRLFRVRSIRKDLRDLSEYSRPKNLANQITFGEERGRRFGNDPCLQSQLRNHACFVDNPLPHRLSDQSAGCVGRRDFGVFDGGRKMYTSAFASKSTLEAVGEAGYFRCRYRSPQVTQPGENLRKGGDFCLLHETLYHTVVPAYGPTSLNRSGRRRRHGQRGSFSERTAQQCVDMTLDILQQPRRSHVSTVQCCEVLGNSFALHRCRGAWKSASEPRKGKLSLDRQSMIKPTRKPLGYSWTVGPSLLESRRSKLTADLFERQSGCQPTIASNGGGQPLPKYPRPSTCSETTRNQSAPERFPNLSGVHRRSKTRDHPSRPAATSYFGNWFGSAHGCGTLNLHKRVRR
uniref:RNA-dependent RNA polymerase n=1 Tax=Exserohilum turcicum narnavirus 5 TaxID=3229037 RepID=A0AAU7YEC8_9VIRU